MSAEKIELVLTQEQLQLAMHHLYTSTMPVDPKLVSLNQAEWMALSAMLTDLLEERKQNSLH